MNSFFYSFCFEDLFSWRNHPYDVSREGLTQHILSEGEKTLEIALRKLHTMSCLKAIKA